ncbi:hypothetical protein GCM10010282_56060 [Streptomyces roseolus]|nr:hypothetical protein GCM10010282_56060 [Streptomyces roseolus]
MITVRRRLRVAVPWRSWSPAWRISGTPRKGPRRGALCPDRRRFRAAGLHAARHLALPGGRTGGLAHRPEAREPARLAFAGTNKAMTADDGLLLEAVSPRETVLPHRASPRFKGLAKLATPF